jgi:putative alpha-1,2-mannosidase
MIGLYPVTSTPNFLISSTPWFSSMTISLSNSKTLQITTTSVNSTASSDAIYIQSLKINSKPWTKNWVTWSDIFANGGTMEYVLGTEPSDWDKNGERPPSLSVVGGGTTASGKRSIRTSR